MENTLKYPKISIVTPSFNQGKYIEETILSVINQGYPNLEYIIIDGGSTDDTVDLIKKYESFISYWVSEPDMGQSDAINKGLAKCSGDVFNWLNSDDCLAENSLYLIGDFFKNKNVDVLLGYCNVFENDTGKVDRTYRAMLKECAEKTLVYATIAQPSTFYRLAIIKEMGGINPKLHYAMDYELWLRYLVQHGQQKVVDTDKALAHFRLHDTSKSVSEEEKFEPEIYAVEFELMKTLGANPLMTFELKKYKKQNFKIEWQIKAIDKKKYLREWCNKYINKYIFFNPDKSKAARYLLADFILRPSITPLKSILKDVLWRKYTNSK